MAVTEAGGGLVFRRLGADDAEPLARLVALYAGTLLGREAGPPNVGYVERLLAEPVVHVAGAELDGRLVGFALYYDLPEAISGGRAGQLDDLFVAPEARGKAIAQKLIGHIVGEGKARDWIHLRWMVPNESPAGALYDRIAERAPWRNYVVRIDPDMTW